MILEEHPERSERDAKRDGPVCIVVRHRLQDHRARTSTATRGKRYLVEWLAVCCARSQMRPSFGNMIGAVEEVTNANVDSDTEPEGVEIVAPVRAV